MVVVSGDKARFFADKNTRSLLRKKSNIFLSSGYGIKLF